MFTDKWRQAVRHDGSPRPVAGFQVGEQPIQWSADGKSLYVYRPGDLPAKVFRLDLTTGQRVMWKDLMPVDPAGVSQIGPVVVTSTANAYVYGYQPHSFRSISG